MQLDSEHTHVRRRLLALAGDDQVLRLQSSEPCVVAPCARSRCAAACHHAQVGAPADLPYMSVSLECTTCAQAHTDMHTVADFCIIPAVFYIVVAAAGLDLGTLRSIGWLFDMGTSRDPWYHFYSLFGECGCTSKILLWLISFQTFVL